VKYVINDITNPILRILNFAITQRFDIACYRKPYKNTINVLLDSNSFTRCLAKTDLKQDGFLIIPFNYDNKIITHLIKNQVHLKIKKNKVKIKKNDCSYDIAKKITSSINKKNHILDNIKLINNINLIDNDFRKLYERAKNSISTEGLEKVVITDTLHKNHNHFNLIDTFNNLCNLYPNCFVNLHITQKYGVYIGASPELFIKFKKNDKTQMFATAGTKKINNETKNIKWTKKEKDEHNIVTKFMQQKLNEIDVCYRTEKTKQIKIKTIAHRTTCLTFSLKKRQMIALLLKVLPTPAVAGYPKKKSLQFIKKHESGIRELYAGCIGVIQNRNLKLWTNIRCAKIFKNSSCVFGGCGITQRSNFMDEEEELRLKIQSIAKLI
jgi:isochorismate synthase